MNSVRQAWCLQMSHSNFPEQTTKINMSETTILNNWRGPEMTPEELMRGIIKSHPEEEDPFFVFKIGNIVETVQNWRRLMPQVDIFYAVKCNDHEDLLKTLAVLGTGFDCASKVEIEKVLALGVDPSRIIYAHPYKQVSYLKYAEKVNVPLMTFDCHEELQKIRNNFPEAQLVLRINCDDPSAIFGFKNKFGAQVQDCKSLLSAAIELDLSVVGVAFHIGTGAKNIETFRKAIAAARKVFDWSEELGVKLYLLDIGGGFPAGPPDLLHPIAAVINSALDEYFPHRDGLKIMAEPGSHLVSTAFSLATKIIATKRTVDEEGVSLMHYINDGNFGSFLLNFLDKEKHYEPKVLMKTEGKLELVKSTIWGGTLAGDDVVCAGVYLPKLELGDWVFWTDMGAYCLPLRTNFNGFPSPRVYISMPLTSCPSSLSSVLLQSSSHKLSYDLETDASGEKSPFMNATFNTGSVNFLERFTDQEERNHKMI